MPKKIVSKEKYDETENLARVAREFLEEERFQIVRDLLNNQLNYIESSILNNSITDARECVTITDKIKKTFFKPKKEQIDELVGQYKLIKDFFASLNYYVNNLTALEKAIEEGEVIVKQKFDKPLEEWIDETVEIPVIEPVLNKNNQIEYKETTKKFKQKTF